MLHPYKFILGIGKYLLKLAFKANYLTTAGTTAHRSWMIDFLNNIFFLIQYLIFSVGPLPTLTWIGFSHYRHLNGVPKSKTCHFPGISLSLILDQGALPKLTMHIFTFQNITGHIIILRLFNSFDDVLPTNRNTRPFLSHFMKWVLLTSGSSFTPHHGSVILMLSLICACDTCLTLIFGISFVFL